MKPKTPKTNAHNGTKGSLVRPVQQRRSRETRDSILRVVAERVQAGRFETATVHHMAQQAGSSVGAFYGRFKDKPAALYCIFDDLCGQHEVSAASLVQTLVSTDLTAFLGGFIDHFVDHSMNHSAYFIAGQKALSSQQESPFVRRSRLLNGRLYGLLLPPLQNRSAQYRHPSAESATLFMLTMVGGMTRDRLLTGMTSAQGSSDNDPFVSELKRAVCAYLGVVTNAA